ncbi:MAG TPA: BMP family ABC transporter substrate-binding protein [Iamia sp.]|nr:BMP family ABC transporter substrate-binding protein [Iamia sp.]
MLRTHRLAAAALAALLALTTAACADNAEESSTGDGGSGGGRETSEGTQPDTNGDGKVVIGVISPGDTDDGQYYEDFLVPARPYIEEQGWELTIIDQVNPADALTQARNLCRQGADMVALAAVELKDALPAADEDVCADSVFTIFGDAEDQLSPSAAQATGQTVETQYLTGVAAGLVLQSQGGTTAGFVGGPELDFAVVSASAFERGMQSVLPDAELLVTYTGDFDDSGKAREATSSQIGSGATLIYAYLGGATDAAASAALEGGALAISPGTDKCDDGEGRYGIASMFASGGYFLNMLNDFAEGDITVGETTVYEVGPDNETPGAKICTDVVEGGDELQAQLEEVAAGIADGSVDVGER